VANAAGDVNGDGIADIVIGAEMADFRNLPGAGQSYVVFGRSATARVGLPIIVDE
jgi:hypothetical protein